MIGLYLDSKKKLQISSLGRNHSRYRSTRLNRNLISFASKYYDLVAAIFGAVSKAWHFVCTAYNISNKDASHMLNDQFISRLHAQINKGNVVVICGYRNLAQIAGSSDSKVQVGFTLIANGGEIERMRGGGRSTSYSYGNISFPEGQGIGGKSHREKFAPFLREVNDGQRSAAHLQALVGTVADGKGLPFLRPLGNAAANVLAQGVVGGENGELNLDAKAVKVILEHPGSEGARPRCSFDTSFRRKLRDVGNVNIG